MISLLPPILFEIVLEGVAMCWPSAPAMARVEHTAQREVAARAQLERFPYDSPSDLRSEDSVSDDGGVGDAS